MADEKKNKSQLIKELHEARQEIATLNIKNQDLEDDDLRIERDALKALMDGLSAIGIGVDVVGTDFRVKSQNQFLQDTFGDITGKLCYENYMKRDQPCESCSMMAAIESGKTERNELTGSDNRIYQVLSAPLPSPDGTTDRAIEVVMDVTERKMTEAALREQQILTEEILNASSIGIACTVDRKVIWTNQAIEQMFGYTKDEVQGMDTLNFYSSQDEYERIGKLMYEQIQDNKLVQIDASFKRHDGSLFNGLLKTNFIELPNNRTSTIVTIIDITERKKAEKEKAQLEEQYHQAQKVESIGRLAGGVAHDLNNLLSPILGYGDILFEEIGPNDKRREYAKQILLAGSRARDLVRQLLAFSRKQTLEYRPADLNTAITGFEKLLRRTIREDIEIDFNPSPDVPGILADIGQIEQVVMNLAVNASDAMPGGGKITIETALAFLDEDYVAAHQGLRPGAYAMMAVNDTGHGIAKDIREKIFEPFFSTKGDRGTGLGLSTVYGIIKQHDGHVWVDSEPGKGTTFKVYLPATEVTHTQSDKDQRTHIDKSEGSETILIVEDDAQVLNLAQAILKRRGYNVLKANSAIRALDILEQHPGKVHLLLTDVVMPELNGKELFTLASRRRPNIKVLYMSGYTDDVIAHRGVALQAH